MNRTSRADSGRTGSGAGSRLDDASALACSELSDRRRSCRGAVQPGSAAPDEDVPLPPTQPTLLRVDAAAAVLVAALVLVVTLVAAVPVARVLPRSV